MKTTIVALALIGVTLALPKHLNGRIEGGTEVAPHSIPYQTRNVIIRESFHPNRLCNGALISKNFALTTASCLRGNDVKLANIFLGQHDFAYSENSVQRKASRKWTIHSGYDASTGANDIALVALPEEAVLNDAVQIAPLPTRAEAATSLVGQTGRVSGWGSDVDDNWVTALSAAITTIVSNTGLPNQLTISNSDILSASDNYGDSGALLVANGKVVGLATVVGGATNRFTDVGKYLDWIAANSDVVVS